MNDEIPEVEVLRIQAGDVIVLHSPKRLPQDVAERIKQQLAKLWPDNHHVIAEAGMKISVAREA